MSNTLRVDAEDEGGVDFRCVLLEVDGDLHKEDIDSLKFLCREFAPQSQLEHIKKGTELFSFLEKTGKLNETNKWVLAEMLKRIMRLDLVETLKVDEKELDKHLDLFGSHFSAYRNLLLDLSNQIGEEDLRKLLFSFVDIPRAKQQKIHSVLDFFLILEQMKKISPENVDILEGSFKHIGRSDLVEKTMNYKQWMGLRTMSTADQSALTKSGNKLEQPVCLPIQEVQGKYQQPTVPKNPQLTQSPTSEPDVFVLMKDIFLKLSTKQYFALGTKLNISDIKLHNFNKLCDSHEKRNMEMMELWLQKMESIDDREKITVLSNAMENCKMIDVLIAALETMFGKQPQALFSDELICYIARNMSNTQYFTLGTMLNVSNKKLNILNVCEKSPPSSEMLKQWFQKMKKGGDDPKKTLIYLSKVMDECKMLHILIEAILEIMFGKQPQGPDISLSKQRVHAANRKDPEISIKGQRAHEVNRAASDFRGVQEQSAACYKMNANPRASYFRGVQEQSADYYKMNANPRGMCLLINNRDFHTYPVKPEAKKLKERKGTDVDVVKLKETFENLQFIVQYKENLTNTDMDETVKGLAFFDHSDYDCVVVCILSHGDEGVVYGCNGLPVWIGELTEPFRPESCPTLSGKPKFFVIQACQGNKKQPADINRKDPQVETNPKEQDLLIGYATVPGYVSYRSNSSGSLYITELTEVLNEHGEKMDILSLLTLVNEKVGKKVKKEDGRMFKQSPALSNSLTKKVILR